MKKYFDWSFYKNEELIEQYKNVERVSNEFIINENLKLVKDNNNLMLIKLTNEYNITVDFINKICIIKLPSEDLLTEINLLEVEIVDKEDKLTIIYMLDNEEKNKLIIDLKE